MKKNRFIIIIALFIFILFGCSNKKEKSPYRKDNKFYFGYYPQTLEKNSKTIKKLNKKAGTPTEGWTSYKYYIEDKVEDFMYYKDIDLDNDNTYDYRGVYFDKYRPFHTHMVSEDSFTNQIRHGYESNNIYYFKYELIEWDILEDNNNNLTIISNLALDAQDFFPSFSRGLLDHDGVLAYANNYELSTIRKWLNEDFYNTAFSSKDKEMINKTLVKNNYEDNNYSSNDTNDFIYLLSEDEVEKYYNSVEERQCDASDYAKCQGIGLISNQSTWQLRTPYTSNANYQLLLDYSGKIIHTEANSTYAGVRPVLNINYGG